MEARLITMDKAGAVFFTASAMSPGRYEIRIQIKTKPPKWTISSPQGFIQSDLENFENELRKALVANLLPYLDGESASNGRISNACAQCNFAELCYAAPGMEDALIASLYTQKQYTPKSHT